MITLLYGVKSRANMINFIGNKTELNGADCEFALYCFKQINRNLASSIDFNFTNYEYERLKGWKRFLFTPLTCFKNQMWIFDRKMSWVTRNKAKKSQRTTAAIEAKMPCILYFKLVLELVPHECFSVYTSMFFEINHRHRFIQRWGSFGDGWKSTLCIITYAF